MGNINLEIRLNFYCTTPDNTNLVRIDVENASDERRLPYTRLAPFVSAVAQVTEPQSSHSRRERYETSGPYISPRPFFITVDYVLTLGILLASHLPERVNFPGRQVSGVAARLVEANQRALL